MYEFIFSEQMRHHIVSSRTDK